MLLSMELEFLGGEVVGGVQTHFRVNPNSVEVVLRLSWGCDKNYVALLGTPSQKMVKRMTSSLNEGGGLETKIIILIVLKE